MQFDCYPYKKRLGHRHDSGETWWGHREKMFNYEPGKTNTANTLISDF